MNLKALTAGTLFLLILSMAAPLYAVSTKEEEAFEKEMKVFYEKEMTYAQEKANQQQTLFKQLENLRTSFNAQDPESTKKVQAQVLEIQKQLEELTMEMSRHEVESATFNVKAAEHRLRKAKRNLEATEEKIKNTKKGIVVPSPLPKVEAPKV